MIRVLRVIALVFCLLLLVGCAATGEWGEEMVYVCIDNGTNTLNYGVTENGELMKLVANHGVEEFDFSSCKTGDVLRVEIYLIEEIFPSNAVYIRCESTGKTAEIELNDSCHGWLDETLQSSEWVIVQ